MAKHRLSVSDVWEDFYLAWLVRYGKQPNTRTWYRRLEDFLSAYPDTRLLEQHAPWSNALYAWEALGFYLCGYDPIYFGEVRWSQFLGDYDQPLWDVTRPGQESRLFALRSFASTREARAALRRGEDLVGMAELATDQVQQRTLYAWEPGEPRPVERLVEFYRAVPPGLNLPRLLPPVAKAAAENPRATPGVPNPLDDLEGLIAYLSMGEVERAIDLLLQHGDVVRRETFALEDARDDASVPAAVRQEISQIVQAKDAYLDELSSEALHAVAQHLDVDRVVGWLQQHSYGEAPLWSEVRLLRSSVQYGWLVHASDQARSIAAEGFTRGAASLDYLAFTEAAPDFLRSGVGYNFAFELAEFERYGRRGERPKYGSGLIVLYAPYVLVWHAGDQEQQAIFWGPDATHVQQVWGGPAEYIVDLEDEAGYLSEYTFGTLEELVEELERRAALA